MRTSRYQMIERADEFHELAVQRRNRGQHHGTSAKGWDRKQNERDDSWECATQAAFEEWHSNVLNARNDFLCACINGPDDDCEIPF